MQLNAKLKIQLSSENNKISLKYDTYEKTSYDYYLIASVCKNFKNKDDAFKYIDEITGKGSLNSHFKKIYSEIAKLNQPQIERILTSSMFPIKILNESESYRYFPDLDLSTFKDKTYKGNLKESKESVGIIKNRLVPNEPDVVFNSIDFHENSENIEKYYDLIFSNEGIKISLDNGKNFFPLPANVLERLYRQDLYIDGYKGKIYSEIAPGNWYALDETVLKNLTEESGNYFYNSEKNHCTVNSEYIKITKILKLFGFYFYSETKYMFSERNKEMSEDYLKYLQEKNKLNEVKVKTLVEILNTVDIFDAKTIANTILNNKSSKEISLFALDCIKKGQTENWTEKTLIRIKEFTQIEDYHHLYKINSNVFELNDIIGMPDNILNKNDLAKKEKYLSEKNNIIKNIQNIIGEIASSSVRENMKKIPTKDSVYKKLNEFIKKYIAHSKVDYSKFSLEELKNRLNEYKKIYDNEYQKIKERISKNTGPKTETII